MQCANTMFFQGGIAFGAFHVDSGMRDRELGISTFSVLPPVVSYRRWVGVGGIVWQNVAARFSPRLALYGPFGTGTMRKKRMWEYR
mgnify:CR=1 FL=1